MRAGADVVVCLQELLVTSTVMAPLRRCLAGHDDIALWGLSHPVGLGIVALARWLAERLDELPPSSPLHLVGYGVGGVAARYCAQELSRGPVVQTLSLQAPFAGIPHARRLGSPLGRELDAASPVLRHLGLAAKRCGAVPHLSIIDDGSLPRDCRGSAHVLPGGDVARIRRGAAGTPAFFEAAARLVERRVLEHAGRGLRRGIDVRRCVGA